jgi:hypothetical protein
MLFCLVESMGFVDFVEGEALFVDERPELALIDKVGNFPKNVTLSFAANTPEQRNRHLFNMKSQTYPTPLKISLVASNVNPFCNQKLENPWLPLFFLDSI